MRKLCLFCIVLCGILLPCLALGEAFPSVYLYTDHQVQIASKEEYLNGHVTAGKIIDAPAQLKGHGNSTWLSSEKKSYRIKFDEKQNPFGIGDAEERDWILLANHFDKSLLRNHLALSLAARLDGLEGFVDFLNVHVYMNDEYMGLYLLCQRVEQGSARLAIQIYDGGFLLEMDTYKTGEGSFVVGNNTFDVKSDYANDDQVDEIYYFIDEVDTAIMTQDEEYAEYIQDWLDVDSWVDAYIIEEFLLNSDVGFSSFNLYRTNADSKLFAGPLWDFDLSAGNHAEANEGSPEGIYAAYLAATVFDHQWFAWLMEMEWFSSLVHERWAEVSDIIDQALADVQELTVNHQEDYARNFERWPVLKEQLWKEPEILLTLGTHAEHSDYLVDWLKERKAWLDIEWGPQAADSDAEAEISE